MKTLLLSILFAMDFCAVHAHVNDTITIAKPERITIITDGERQIIEIQGKQGNPDYTYHSESALNGGSFVYANDNRGWNFSLPEFQNSEAVVWKNPVFDWTSARAWFFIDRVELTDTATTVYVTHQVVPQFQYMFNGLDEYLVTDRGERYRLHSVEGMTLGEWHHKSYHDTEHYRFHFDPVPKDTKWVNFITEEEAEGNCYNYFFLHDEDQPIAHDVAGKDWENLTYDEHEELPRAFDYRHLKKPQTATLKVHLLNYQHSMFDNDAVMYFDNCSKQQQLMHIAPDHTVTITLDIKEPVLLQFTMGNIWPGGICVLLPGETTECLLNLLSTEEGDEFSCEYKGRLALTNKQLTTYGLPLELRRHLKNLPDIHQRLLHLTPAARTIVHQDGSADLFPNELRMMMLHQDKELSLQNHNKLRYEKETIMNDVYLLSASVQATTYEDSLKQKAKAYLMEHGPMHRARKSVSMDKYLETLRDINHRYVYPESWEKLKNLVESNAQPVGRDWTDVVYDADMLTAGFLDRQVERAFRWWREGKYARHLSFDEFCEYLLPYRFCNEQLEDYFDELSAEYAPCLRELDDNVVRAGSAYWAAQRLGEEIVRRMGYHLGTMLMLEPIDLPYSVLKEMHQGMESDYVLLTAMVLRACGVPAAIDFAPWPQYADSARGRRTYCHIWNSVLDNSGRTVPFCIGPDGVHRQGFRLGPVGKVYRYTFARQPQSLSAMNEEYGDSLPDIISTPFIKDVTNEYMETVNIRVDFSHNVPEGHHFVYLSVFRGEHGSVIDNWRSVAFARLEGDNTALFSQMGRGVVYLPCLKGDKHPFRIRPAGYPIEVAPDGCTRQLIPSNDRRQAQKVEVKQMPDRGGRMVAVNDDDIFELYCFGEHGEKYIGSVKASGGLLVLENLPSDALFRLHRKIAVREGVYRHESCLFTVKDGEVRWY